MPWPLKWHPEGCPEKPQPGDCYPALHYLDPDRAERLAPKYRERHAGKRPPINVVLPGSAGDFCVDGRCFSDQGWYGEGWDVTGDPAAGTLTVSPSINIVGHYHGWLRDGVLSDDVEGRKFP